MHLFRTLPAVLFAILGSTGTVAAPAGLPANPHAHARTRAVLAYLTALEQRPDRRLLSGQFVDFGAGASLRLLEQIHALSGQWPALIGVDYADLKAGDLTLAAPNQAALAYWKKGGLPMISAHLYNPANPRRGGVRDRGVDLDALLADGTPTHAAWMRELDQLAGGLQALRDAGVVVLWRPFHEMNGGWFWWGGHPPEKFIRVWRHMFDYFTRTKGLDNLLWVYGPNHGPRTAAYYPGDDFVDVVGLDAYTDFVDRDHIHGYDEIARLPKPFGFAEFGPHGPEHPPANFDYRRLLAGIRAHFPRAVFFHAWNANWSLARNPHAAEMLNDPWCVNLADLPRGLAGGP